MDTLLYPPLSGGVVNFADRFREAYNYKIQEYVDRNRFREGNQSGGKQILYLSYSHAIRLLRTLFPEVEVACEVNPENGSFLYAEADGRGFFLKGYCYTYSESAYYRSSSVYFAVLSSAGLSISADDRDKNGAYKANIQEFNKAYYRACTKAIAWSTGIGLKLWTGEDLDSDIIDEKLEKIDLVYNLMHQYEQLTGTRFELEEIDYTTPVAHINAAGKTLTKLIAEAKAGQTGKDLVDLVID